MLHEFIQHHPNDAKFLLCNNAFFSVRSALSARILDLSMMTDKTILQDDVDVKRQLGSLKRALNGLTERQDNIVKPDLQKCAQMLLTFEDELYRDLIDGCRYYKGEEKNPFDGRDGNHSLFWFYEQCWIRFKRDPKEQEHLCNDVVDYIRCGLMEFNDNDHVPISLKAILWNRYCHWGYCSTPEGFISWYIKNYIG